MPRDIAFCKAWLEHFDLRISWQAAGYSLKNKGWASRAQLKLKRFSKYLKPLQDAKAIQVGRQLATDGRDVLETMRQIAFADPLDYFVVSDEPVTRKERDANGNVIHVPVTVHGRPVYNMVQKPLEELTREQAMAVVPIVTSSGSKPSYRLPTLRERHAYLESLGRNLGLFLEDTAKENHAHHHGHTHLHLDNVSTNELVKLQQHLISVVGAEQARAIGLSQQEIDDSEKVYGNLRMSSEGEP